MSDPDGTRGEGRKTVTVRTRPEPMPAAGGRVFHVYPPGFSGQKLEPAFEGLMCAYNLTCSGTDWATAGRPRVRPGDTILVHAGVYKYNRFRLKPGSAAVDRGVALPNVNDGFSGRAPDLGALELGRPLPHFGPRR